MARASVQVARQKRLELARIKDQFDHAQLVFKQHFQLRPYIKA